MAKFRSVAAITSLQNSSEFKMGDDYGSKLRNNAEMKVDNDIQEVEETLYGEHSHVSHNQSDVDDGISIVNAKKNINFDPAVMNHRK